MSELLQEATHHQQASGYAEQTYSGYLPATPYTSGYNDGPRTWKPQRSRQKPAPAPAPNPLADVLPDDLYAVLRANDLINEKALRDFVIRRQFQEIKREKNMKTMEAISYLQEQHPYLQLDTIRKIVYKVYPTSQKKRMI